MVLPAILALAGVSLIVLATWRFGFSRYQSVFSPPGFLTLGGIALLTVAIFLGVIQSNSGQDRAKLDASLVKMFGRLPHRLDLEGNNISSFNGIAYYDGKRFRLKTECDSFNDKLAHYVVIATPMDTTSSGEKENEH